MHHVIPYQSLTDGRLRIRDLIDKLEPEVFENLIFDCAIASGLRNVVWRTPGADGGRDIEGQASHVDISGQDIVAKWYIECKRYATSLSWPLVWEKIAHADVQGADVLLIATNSQPSPACETEVTRWNGDRRRPLVRFWRGYQLPGIIRVHPHIGLSYGLISPGVTVEASLMPLALIGSKVAQAAHTAMSLGVPAQYRLEASAAIAELLSQRLDDLNRYSCIVPAAHASVRPEYDWLKSSGDASEWEDVGLRAMLVFLHYLHGEPVLTVEFDGKSASVMLDSPKIKLGLAGVRDLNIVSYWSRVEVKLDPSDPVRIALAQRS